MSPLNIGQLRHHGYIESRTVTTDAAQETIDAWGQFHEWYCRIEPQSMTESQRGGSSGPIDADATHLLTGWWIEGVKPDMRFKHDDGRVYEFVSILNEDERDEKIIIAAREAILVQGAVNAG